MPAHTVEGRRSHPTRGSRAAAPNDSPSDPRSLNTGLHTVETSGSLQNSGCLVTGILLTYTKLGFSILCFFFYIGV